MEVGDILVFIGNNTGVSHYDNFTVGKKYEISNISPITYGIDDLYHEHSTAILFLNYNYGTYVQEVDKYFVHLDDYRNKKIGELYD